MFQDFLAAVRIELGNFYEQNIDFFWFFVSVFVLALILIPLINTLRMGKVPKGKERYKITAAPDQQLKERASKSLAMAVNIPAEENNPEAMDRFRRMIEGRYPGVFQELRSDVYGAGSFLFFWPSKAETKDAPAVFCSHFDVKAKNLEEQAPEPEEYVEKSIVSGPGSSGGKSNVIAMLEAIESLIQSGYAPAKRDLYFAFGHDGLSGGQNGMFNIVRMFYRRKILPAFVLYGAGNIMPYALSNRFFASAVINVAEKGRLKLKLIAGPKGRLPAETGDESNKKKNTGDAGQVLLEALERIEAAPLKTRINDIARKHYRIMAPALTFPERFAVGNLPFTKKLFFHLFEDPSKSNAMLKTTVQIESSQVIKEGSDLSERAEAVLDIRLLSGDTAKYVVDYIKDITSDLPLSIHELEAIEASSGSSTASSAYRMIFQTAQKRFGRILIAPGITEESNGARYFERVCDKVYRFSPVLAETKSSATQGKESVRDTSFGAAVETYISLIKSAGSETI